jgi:hypothetical protein
VRGLLIPVSAAAVLAALVAWMGYRAYNVELSPLPPEERVTDSGGAEPGALAQRQPVPVFDDTDFIERPLFWQTRRPVEDEEPVAEEAEEKPPAELPAELSVSGVIQDGSDWFVVAALAGKPLRLRAGEKVQGWTVKEISPDNVTFESGAKTASVKLFEPKPAAAAPKASKRKKRVQTRRQPGADKREGKAKAPPQPQRSGTNVNGPAE